MSKRDVLRSGFALALGVAAMATTACAAQEQQTQRMTPQLSYQQRCNGFTDDGPVADVLSGKAVESIAPLYWGASNSKSSNPRLQGAVLVVRPAPGETAEWLDRALECHSARASAAGSGSANDPFMLPGSAPQISVRSSGDGFRIEVASASSEGARAILSRAEAFGSTVTALATQPPLP